MKTAYNDQFVFLGKVSALTLGWGCTGNESARKPLFCLPKHEIK